MGMHLVLKFFNPCIDCFNHFLFDLKLSFYLFEDLFLNFLSLDFAFKIRNFFVFLLSDCLDDLFFMVLDNIIDLRKVGIYNVCHSAKVFKQCRNFLLEGRAKGIRLHHSDRTLNFFLIRGILCYQSD
jgi:hypothetical protein